MQFINDKIRLLSAVLLSFYNMLVEVNYLILLLKLGNFLNK